jgi:hypothetical protein
MRAGISARRNKSGGASKRNNAAASHNEINDTMNVLQLEETSDAKALPRQEISDEVYR